MMKLNLHLIRKRTILYFMLFLSVTSFFVGVKNVLAADETFYSQNDILFYNPDDKVCSTATIATTAGVFSGDSVASFTLNDTTKLIFQLLINGGMSSVQAAAVMGNMYTESRFDPDVHEYGNDIGYGLVQWSFGRRDALEAYAASKGVPPSDIPMQIEFLYVEYNGTYKTRLQGTAFEAGTDIAAATEAWMVKFEVPAMKPANDPAKLNSERIPMAIKIYNEYKSLAPATSASVGKNCTTGNGVVAGNIVETALGLALATPAINGMTGKSDARESYQIMKEKLVPEGSWSDCGVFVAVVMIASGVDPNYPHVGVGAQTAYVKAHPEKYEIITNPVRDQLQPGDILLTSGHTTIYTGKTPYSAVDASLDERVPSVRYEGSTTSMLGDGAIVARVK